MSRQPLYDGKAKTLFAADQPDQVVHYFKDDATAFNAQKRGAIAEKGTINNRISERLFQLLAAAQVPTHFIRRLNDREMLTARVTIIPLEVVVRNRVAGSLAKRLGLKEGEQVFPPLVEFYYKNDGLGDPLVTEEHIRVLKLADPIQVSDMKRLALRVNEVLMPFWPSVS